MIGRYWKGEGGQAFDWLFRGIGIQQGSKNKQRHSRRRRRKAFLAVEWKLQTPDAREVQSYDNKGSAHGVGGSMLPFGLLAWHQGGVVWVLAGWRGGEGRVDGKPFS
jgi:hypothetical protein